LNGKNKIDHFKAFLSLKLIHQRAKKSTFTAFPYKI
jgi:hypothetical protein